MHYEREEHIKRNDNTNDSNLNNKSNNEEIILLSILFIYTIFINNINTYAI